MRLLHTADWHLGRTLHQSDLSEDHAAYLDHLIDLVRSESVDAVLVSGDVYDRAFPPVDSVKLLHATLRRLTELTHVILTAGNHDSAQRLGFLEGLTNERLHLRTSPRSALQPVTIPSASGPACFLAIPYLDVDAARRAFALPDGQLPARSHEAVMNAVVRELDPVAAAAREAGAHLVVAAHAFVAGGEPSESERDIRVGGVDRIPVGVFAPLSADYVALGHLHRPQNISAASRTRYSGSPLAFSFSEANDVKSSSLVDITSAGVSLEEIPAPVRHPLAVVRGTLAELLGRTDVSDKTRVKAILTDTVRPREAFTQLKDHFPHLLALTHEPTEVIRESVTVTARQLADPLTVVETFVSHVTGEDMTAPQRSVLQDTYEGLLAKERTR